MKEMQKLLKEILNDKKSITIIVDALSSYEKWQRYEAKHTRDSLKWNKYEDVSEVLKEADDLEKKCNHIQYIYEEFLEYKLSNMEENNELRKL